MTADVRLVTAADVPAWARSVNVPFLSPPEAGAATEAIWRRHLQPGRAWAAVDGERFVGTCCTFTRQVTLPGSALKPGPSVPLAAVTAVGVHPTHRRQGLLGRFMRTMLDDARERGEPLAGLVASESSIYGRYGFGVATHAAAYALATARSAFAAPVPPVDVTLLDAREAVSVVPALFERLRSGQAGQVNRSPAVWMSILEDQPALRQGRTANFYAVTDGGFAIYRAERVIEHDHVDDWGRIHLADLVGETPEIEAALWRFVLDLDLVREVVAWPRPVAEPLAMRLADPRQLRTTAVADFLWLRVLDLPGALEARGYRAAGTLVVDVAPNGDGHEDAVTGRWRLDADRDGATCRRPRPGEPTDLRLGVAELGPLLTGGIRPSLLAAAGRIVEDREGALETADAVFRATPDPFCSTGF